MAFIYDSRVTVRSVIDNLDAVGLPEGESEISITTHDAFLKVTPREEGDLIVISYSETVEGDRIYTELTLDGGTVTLARHGATEYTIRFTEGGEHVGIYEVAPYKFDMRVLTKRIRNGVTRRGGELRITKELRTVVLERTLESLLDCKEIKPMNPKGK